MSSSTAAGSIVALMLCIASPAWSAEERRITNIYDAFGVPDKALVKDWGYAALIEYGGRRILFDTGNHADIFEHNVKALGVDLTRLDAVIISHRHGDHTSGLTYLLKMNPQVPIYVPREGAYFKGAIPAEFLEREPGLPLSLQYFEGKGFTRSTTGSPWEEANFKTVTANEEIFPGFHLLIVQSQKPGTVEMNELSLGIRTPQGLAVVVGCSHPGVEKILEEAAKIDPRLYTVTGGFHLVRTPEPEVTRVAMLLRDRLSVRRVAPAHCTSERGFAIFRRVFGDRFDEAGLGASIALP
ncbi:MAG TPA: MBL fold metallo-hydrolase [Steroidobacteraceae bacterium]|jgi:7,8-dihydropterin-6-yl-methyl-4-(beta-D-ribofuranosyl)aminobenzene 5'-phosphate synthase|nr:MBL fold metallo-hydrolase [Steroidobacteraceae bacterium]